MPAWESINPHTFSCCEMRSQNWKAWQLYGPGDVSLIRTPSTAKPRKSLKQKTTLLQLPDSSKPPWKPQNKGMVMQHHGCFATAPEHHGSVRALPPPRFFAPKALVSCNIQLSVSAQVLPSWSMCLYSNTWGKNLICLPFAIYRPILMIDMRNRILPEGLSSWLPLASRQSLTPLKSTA